MPYSFSHVEILRYFYLDLKRIEDFFLIFIGFPQYRIRRIYSEWKKTGGLLSNYCEIRNRQSAWDKLKPEQIGMIRRKIHAEFEKASKREFLESGFPTLKQMFSKINELPDIGPLGFSPFRSILAHMGFKFRNRAENSDPLVISDQRIISLRRTYVKKFFEAMSSGQKVYFSDETYVHQYHSVVSVVLTLFKMNLILTLNFNLATQYLVKSILKEFLILRKSYKLKTSYIQSKQFKMFGNVFLSRPMKNHWMLKLCYRKSFYANISFLFFGVDQ